MRHAAATLTLQTEVSNYPTRTKANLNSFGAKQPNEHSAWRHRRLFMQMTQG
jgi:hypothetical protein